MGRVLFLAVVFGVIGGFAGLIVGQSVGVDGGQAMSIPSGLVGICCAVVTQDSDKITRR